jgi:hypothetical protein
MSRSFYQSNFRGVCGKRISEKFCKKKWHKKWRMSQKQLNLQNIRKDNLDILCVHFKEVSDPWNMAKDGPAHWEFYGDNGKFGLANWPQKYKWERK